MTRVRAHGPSRPLSRGHELRSADPPAPLTVFLVGTGSQIGSWAPIYAAIRRALGEGFPEKQGDLPEGDDPILTDVTNFHLARWVAQQRTFWRLAHDPLEPKRAKAAAVYELIDGIEKKFKAAMSDELLRATQAGALRLRPEFIEMFKRLPREGSVAFVTANWDTVLENWVRTWTEKPLVQYLHGSVAAPNLMLLPGENIHEDYRPREERKQLDAMLNKWGYFDRARRIIIYGLSLSPLDAELSILLGMGFADSIGGEIWIVNPAEGKTVQRRVQTLDPKNRWTIKVVAPGEVG